MARSAVLPCPDELQLIEFLLFTKAAPLSVLPTLLFTGEAMSNCDLRLWTGYHQDTIRRALRFPD